MLACCARLLPPSSLAGNSGPSAPGRQPAVIDPPAPVPYHPASILRQAGGPFQTRRAGMGSGYVVVIRARFRSRCLASAGHGYGPACARALGTTPGTMPCRVSYARIRRVALSWGYTLGTRAHPPHLSVNDSAGSAGWCSLLAVMLPRMRRSSCCGTRSRSCGVRSCGRGRTGLTVPCSPRWRDAAWARAAAPDHDPGDAAATGDSGRACAGKSDVALWRGRGRCDALCTGGPGRLSRHCEIWRRRVRWQSPGRCRRARAVIPERPSRLRSRP